MTNNDIKESNVISIYSLTLQELKDNLIANGFKSYVAEQIYDWIYKKDVDDFEKMTNLSKQTIFFLKQNYFFDVIKINTIQEDKDGTVKFLLELCDNNLIEVVLMSFDYGYSVCVTSQVGCNMGCKFCASGLIKKVRNITTGEFIKQFLLAKQYLYKTKKENLSHMVVMGIGEPFDNFNNLVQFMKVIKEQKGLGIGGRKITVSTCGLVHKIKEWADLNNQVNLAISLHGSNNEIRSKIMPINGSFNIEKLLEAIDYYLEKTNRRVTIEYIMIKDLNDKKEHAYELIEMFKNRLVYINLIPYNPVFENSYARSEKCKEFYDILKNSGITCTIRQEKGSSIDAACGQLRSKRLGVL